MNLKLCFTIAINVMCFFSIHGQTWEWSRDWGRMHNVGALVSTSSFEGYFYYASSFSDTLDVDPGPDTIQFIAIGPSDLFLSKFDSSGILIWSIHIKGTGTENIGALTFDKNGNIVLGGDFSGMLDFNPSPTANKTFTSIGNPDAFIASYDTSGMLLWSHVWGGGSYTKVFQVAVDDLNNIFVAGAFSGTVDFNPDTGLTFYLASGINRSCYISKFNTLLNFEWAIQEGYPGEMNFSKILGDGTGGLISIGSFIYKTDFDPDPFVVYYLYGDSTFPTVADGFIQKLDSVGRLEWVRQIDTDEGVYLKDFILDQSGNLLITGYCKGATDFDPDSINEHVIYTPLHSDAFILQLDNLGNFQRVTRWGGSSVDAGNSIIIDQDGFIYVSGYFSLISDLDPGGGVYNASALSQRDLFVIKTDPDFNLVWAMTAGGYSHDESQRLFLDSSGNVYSFGTTQSTNIHFGSDTLFIHDATLAYKLFIAKIDVSTIGLSEVYSFDEIDIFPNPASKYFTLMSDEHVRCVQIYNLSGQLEKTFETTDRYNISELCPGLYIIKILLNEGEISRKLILAR